MQKERNKEGEKGEENGIKRDRRGGMGRGKGKKEGGKEGRRAKDEGGSVSLTDCHMPSNCGASLTLHGFT